MTAQTITLVEVTVYDAAIATTRVLRYATGRGFTTKPSETPASTFYDAKIRSAPDIKQDLFSSGTTSGRSRVGFGDLVLINDDGALDTLLTYAFDGRSLVVRTGLETAAFPSGFTTVFSGTMEQAEVSRQAVTIKLRDNQLLADIPLQPVKFAGTNVLPAGLEGTTDLQGKQKPLNFGVNLNVSPPVVNTSKQIYQVDGGPYGAVVDAVYDRGIALTNGGTYANLVALENNALAPAAGAYKSYSGGANGTYFRLGSSPAGTVTSDVSGDFTAGRIFENLITYSSPWGISGATFHSGDTAALAGSAMGFWYNEEITIAAALDRLTNAIGAWWGTDAAGAFRVKVLEAPSGTPAVTLTETDVIGLERIATTDEDRGIPTYRVVTQYSPNHTVQTTDLAAGVTDARRAELAQPYKTFVTEDLSVLTEHPLARERVNPGTWYDIGGASVNATATLTLRKVRRDRFEFRMAADTVPAAMVMGAVVSLTHSRFGLAAGKLFLVLGLATDTSGQLVQVTLWG